MLALLDIVIDNEARYQILDTDDNDITWVGENDYYYLTEKGYIDKKAHFKYYSFTPNLYMLDYLNQQLVFKDNKMIAKLYYASTNLPSIWYDIEKELIIGMDETNCLTFTSTKTGEKTQDRFGQAITKILKKENKVGKTKYRRYMAKRGEDFYDDYTFDFYTGFLRYIDSSGSQFLTKEIWGTKHFAHESTRYREYYDRSGHIVDKDLHPLFSDKIYSLLRIKQPIYQQLMIKEVCNIFQRYIPIRITYNDEYCMRYILCENPELRRLTRELALDVYLRTIHYAVTYNADGWFMSFKYMPSPSVHDAYETNTVKLNIDMKQIRSEDFACNN